jgi:transaldolase / glucose-6-phosphate isomerase
VQVIDRISFRLPQELTTAVNSSIEDWQKNNKVKRLWDKDASLWTSEDEGKWLDWLHITSDQIKQLDALQKIAAEVKQEGFTHILLLGMGGSSLCPEVLSITFGKINGFPKLLILDSTDPQEVQTRLDSIDLKKTLFIVSSKSGSTLEPNIFKQFFYAQAEKAVGKGNAGKHFIAITDPGSKMEEVAKKDGFRHIFYGLPGIGGRYSALSNFGMVPAACAGIDVAKFLKHTQEMVESCSASHTVEENPGVILGIILGVAARSGRDKLTFITSPAIYDLGAWLEQLIAESTGKQGHGIIPVDREHVSSPSAYGKDRVFAYIRLESDACTEQDKLVDALEKAGQPVVRISLPDIYHLGQEFFRWEIATAVAGSIIGINAFNQPDVEASKVVTRELTSAYEKTGSLPAEKPFFEEDGIKLFTNDANAKAITEAAAEKTLNGMLKAHLSRLSPGDYFALLAYIEMNSQHEKALQEIRHLVRDSRHEATCLGFGPRFLHSTGQAYKGGPNSGVFLQITADDVKDLPVPEQTYTFGVVKSAQARGDFQVLAERQRRALRVHLTGGVEKGLARLKEAITHSLS